MTAPILRRLRRFAFAMMGSKVEGDDVLCMFLGAEGSARAVEAGAAVECFASFFSWLDGRDAAAPSPALSPLHQALVVQPPDARAALFLTVAEAFEPADAARVVGCSEPEVEALAAAARRSIDAAAAPRRGSGEVGMTSRADA